MKRLFVLLVIPVACLAGDTKTSEVSRKDQFMDAFRLESVVVTSDGELRLGYDTSVLQAKDEQAFFCGVQNEGLLYVGAASGKIYVSDGKEIKLHADTKNGIVTSMVFWKDSLYAATADVYGAISGKIYRVDKDAKEVANCEKGVPVCLIASGEKLLVVTTKPAKILEVTSDGKLNEVADLKAEVCTAVHKTGKGAYVGTANPSYLEYFDGKAAHIRRELADGEVSAMATVDGTVMVAVGPKNGKAKYEILNCFTPKQKPAEQPKEITPEKNPPPEKQKPTKGVGMTLKGSWAFTVEMGNFTADGKLDVVDVKDGQFSGKMTATAMEQEYTADFSGTFKESGEIEIAMKVSDFNAEVQIKGKVAGFELNGTVKLTMEGQEEPAEGTFTAKKEAMEFIFFTDDPVSGEWEGKAKEPMSGKEETLSLSMKNDKGNVTGEMFSPLDKERIQLKGTYSGGNLKLSGEMSKENIKAQITLEGSVSNNTFDATLNLVIDMQGQQIPPMSIKVTFTRKSGGGTEEKTETVPAKGKKEGGEEQPVQPPPQQQQFNTNPMASGVRSYMLSIDKSGLISFAKEYTFYMSSMHSFNGGSIACTDSGLKIVKFNGDGEWDLVASFVDVKAGTEIVADTNEYYVLTSAPAGIVRVKSTQAKSGSFVSKAIDAGSSAEWLSLDVAASGQATAFVRYGNTSNLKDGWAEWGNAISDFPAKIEAPRSRFLQIKIEVSGKKSVVRRVSVSYRTENTPPKITSINIAPVPPMGAPPAPMGAYPTGPVIIMGQKLGIPHSTQFTVSCAAMDADGDLLKYKFFYKCEKDGVWVPMSMMTPYQPSLQWNTEEVQDGRYKIKVVATDESSNFASDAKTTEFETEFFTIDNTPPALSVTQTNGKLTVEATDSLSPIARIEYRIDSDKWMQSKFNSDEAGLSASASIPVTGKSITIRAFDKEMNLRSTVYTVEK